MKTKKCYICNIEKPLNEYHKDKNRKYGVRDYCKDCIKHYNKTPKRLLSKIYRDQKRLSKRRGHPLPSYTFEELCQWFVLQPNWEELYYKWQASGYNRNLAPSIDRIDDNKGYSLDNIQLMTAYENLKKETEQLKKHINQYDLDGNYIRTWGSLLSVQNNLGIPVSNLSFALKFKNKQVRGYQWRYLSEEYPKYQNISKYFNAHSKPILCVFSNKRKIFNSTKECAEYFNCSVGVIKNKLNGKQNKLKQLQNVTLMYYKDYKQQNNQLLKIVLKYKEQLPKHIKYTLVKILLKHYNKE